ncbi:hypothetical protein [Halopenitus persicus]|uniref:ICEA Protein n=1 Tax=Halopenitus persicus TaxID=1048396 RepID=A0A1H3HCA8_9EURY|nr:hypothetical protein [Halopenitus persicus]QHS16026.1 hypothetical protein GWK26_02035 [haloarchaeon 3A1-DGR]SDY12970.1 hypothetical protein SAMN05216564_103212 [Halopenitus persicus]
MDDQTAQLVAELREDDARKRAVDLLTEAPRTPAELRSETGLDAAELDPILEAALEQELLERVDGDRLALTEWGERAAEFVLVEDWNPSSLSTKKGRTFDVLADGEWHCSECELSGSQPAAYIRDFRDEGFEFVSTTSGRGEYARRYCETCGEETTHRRLKYAFPSAKPITRQEMPESFKKRVRELYDGRDAFDLSTPGGTPEVDHRRPRIRWDEPEDFDYESMSDAAIREHFQILSGQHNLLKSRQCEQCVETGERPPFFGVEFYYEGGPEYEDDVGCEGCGWYNPHRWRDALTDVIERAEE